MSKLLEGYQLYGWKPVLVEYELEYDEEAVWHFAKFIHVWCLLMNDKGELERVDILSILSFDEEYKLKNYIEALPRD